MYVVSLFSAVLVATVDCVGTHPPLRRFYIYNPKFLPHVAAALNMLIPQSLYDHVQYQDDHEDIEEHSEHGHDSQPLQLFTLIKPKQQKKRVIKRRPNGKKVKRIKKGPRKCMPFKVRFIKKIDDYSPFSFSQTRPVRRIRPSSSWSRMSKWRVAAPGASVTEYPLQEPIPSATRGTPPASLLYNVYEDSRIPVKEVVTPNYLHLYNEPDYYQHGVYQSKTEASVNVNFTNDVLVYTSNGSTEKVVTVTPTTAWVPLPKFYRVTQAVSKDDGENILLTKRCSLDKCWESLDNKIYQDNISKSQNSTRK